MYVIIKYDQTNHNPQYKKLSLFSLESSNQVTKKKGRKTFQIMITQTALEWKIMLRLIKHPLTDAGHCTEGFSSTFDWTFVTLEIQGFDSIIC